MTIKNIVLVHGAFADGSCYADTIARLQSLGFHATAVQNPLSSLEADVQAIQRVLDRQNGPTLLVGHSWAGVPITQAGLHNNVAGVVYLSAIVPDNNEAAAEALQRNNAPMEGLEPDANGEIVLPFDVFKQVMGNDLSGLRNELLTAVQVPMNARAFGDKIEQAAWRKKPSFYLLTEKDNALPFEVQKRFAEQIKAETKTLATGHLSMIAQPNTIANWLSEIAKKLD